MRRSFPSVFGVITVLVALLAVACANPLDRDDADATADPGEATATALATSTSVVMMRIVTPTPIPAGATVVPEATVDQGVAERPETYVVAEGDTLYEIALRFGVEIRQIIELNGLSDPNDIYAGQELRLPPQE